ncbi:glycosyl hydrolase family 61-domain-containing protein [Mycena vulgaris]|nr:glycosyl hydrolase family 61-domain-containing protein [Mycena vulgaris]
MKSLSVLIATASLLAKVSAHYTWPQLIVGGTNTSAWQYVRETNNWQNLNPLTDVTSADVRCYSSQESGTASTMSVAAGSTVGFTVDGNPSNLYHDGVVNVYMAKAPAGTDVANWDGSGSVWFKIYQIPAVTDGGTTITFPATGLTQVTFPIPSETPSGQYLIRVEHIALHVASSFGGAQFYIACAQVEVLTSGGTGTPGPLVAFPGEYTVSPSPRFVNIYYPIPANYVQPGPPVWPSAGSGAVRLCVFRSFQANLRDSPRLRPRPLPRVHQRRRRQQRPPPPRQAPLPRARRHRAPARRNTPSAEARAGRGRRLGGFKSTLARLLAGLSIISSSVAPFACTVTNRS